MTHQSRAILQRNILVVLYNAVKKTKGANPNEPRVKK